MLPHINSPILSFLLSSGVSHLRLIILTFPSSFPLTCGPFIILSHYNMQSFIFPYSILASFCLPFHPSICVHWLIHSLVYSPTTVSLILYLFHPPTNPNMSQFFHSSFPISTSPVIPLAILPISTSFHLSSLSSL